MDALDSPVNFLSAMLGANLPDEPVLRAYEAQCRRIPVSALAEGAPDPDDIRRGYAAGVVWRGFVQETALPVFLHLYIATFHDPRLVDVFTPTLIVTQMVDKYAPEPMRSTWLERLKARDGSTPQGAVYTLTPSSRSPEDRGEETLTPNPFAASGSGQQKDAGPLTPSGRGERDILRATLDISETNQQENTEDTAQVWRLSGRVDATRNLDAELAVVAARVEGAEAPALFLVSRLRDDGSLNFQAGESGVTLDRSEACLLGDLSDGPELMEEIEGLELAAGAMSDTAFAQRHFSDYPNDRTKYSGFMKPAFAGTWASIELLNWTWREMPITISDSARLFHCLVRIARINVRGVLGALGHIAKDRAQSLPIGLIAFSEESWNPWRSGTIIYTRHLLSDITIGSNLLALLGPHFDPAQLHSIETSRNRRPYDESAHEAFELIAAVTIGVPKALAQHLDAARVIAGDSLYA